MLRAVLSTAVCVTRTAQKTVQKKQLLQCLSVSGMHRLYSTTENSPAHPTHDESYKLDAMDEDFDEGEMIKYLKSPHISGYDIRTYVNSIQGMDQIPSGDLISAMMHACRNVNDYAMAVRILESVKVKCGKGTDIYASLMQSVKPTLEELGVLTPEEMGYDKPELYLKDPFDIHN